MMHQPHLTDLQKSQLVIQVLTNSFMKVNEERIQEWINDWLDTNMEGDIPTFEQFMDSFSFDSGFEEPSLGLMLNEMLQFIDLGGYCVMDAVIRNIEKQFDTMFSEIVKQRKERAEEMKELHSSYEIYV